MLTAALSVHIRSEVLVFARLELFPVTFDKLVVSLSIENVLEVVLFSVDCVFIIGKNVS